MKKYRQYDTPQGWCFDQSYSDVMQLRSAYNAGFKTDETRQAAKVYIAWMRLKALRGGHE